MSVQKPGAPPSGLYLKCDLSQFTDELQKLRQIFMVLNRSDYEKNMYAVEIDAGPEPDFQTLADFVALIRSNGIVALVQGDIGLALRAEADGVVLARGEDVAPACAMLGEDALVGLRCGTDTQAGVRAFRDGADFVVFSAALGPQEIMKFIALHGDSCVVEGLRDNESCGAYVMAGATLIEASGYIFAHTKGVMQGAVNMLYAIDQASAPPSVN